MDLTRELVETKAREYADSQPLATVEREHLEMLPGMLAGEEFGWRDVEWVVQWYFRRYLGDYPDRERRAVEGAFRDNDFEEVLSALSASTEADDVTERLEKLRSLDGVDVPVGSAFLQFMFPDNHIVVDGRLWGVLAEAGYLDDQYPDPPSIDEYLRYLEVCRSLCEQFGIDMWELYCGLWQLGHQRVDRER